MTSSFVSILQLRVRAASFLQWWWMVLLDVLPTSFVALLAGDLRRIRVTSSLDVVSLLDQRRKVCLKAEWSEAEARWFPDSAWRRIEAIKRTRPTELLLSDSELLRQELHLPRVALENLDGSVQHGLSTWSPFSPEEVYVAAAHPFSQDIGSVELRYAVRALADPIISKAAGRGLDIDQLVLGHDRWCVTIGGRVAARIKRQHWADGALALSAASLIVLVLNVAWTWQSSAIDRVNQELRNEIALARRQAHIEGAIEYAAKARKALDAERETTPSVSEVLAHFESMLPSDAVVIKLELERTKGVVTIEPKSPQDLTATLARSPLLRDVQFSPDTSVAPTVPGLSSGFAQVFSFSLAKRGAQ